MPNRGLISTTLARWRRPRLPWANRLGPTTAQRTPCGPYRRQPAAVARGRTARRGELRLTHAGIYRIDPDEAGEERRKEPTDDYRLEDCAITSEVVDDAFPTCTKFTAERGIMRVRPSRRLRPTDPRPLPDSCRRIALGRVINAGHLCMRSGPSRQECRLPRGRIHVSRTGPSSEKPVRPRVSRSSRVSRGQFNTTSGCRVRR